MQSYLTLFYGLCMSVLRRCMGTQFYIKGKKISRIWKNVVYILVLCCMVWTSGNLPKTWLAAAGVLWYIAWTVRYWNHSHKGMYYLFDDTPFRPKYGWIRVILNKIFGHKKYYNFAGKFIGLTLGYLVPALLASITMPYHWFWVAGFTTPIGYALCGVALGKDSNTEWAEYLNGFTMGIIFYCCL